MKKLLFFFFAFFLYAGVMSAQSHNPSELAQTLTDNLDEMVNLTDQQEAQILDINETKLTEVQQHATAQNWTQRKSVALARIIDIKAVLTVAQRNTLEQLKNSQTKGVYKDF